MLNVDNNPSGLVLANDGIFSDRDGATRFSKSLYFTGLRQQGVWKSRKPESGIGTEWEQEPEPEPETAT